MLLPPSILVVLLFSDLSWLWWNHRILKQEKDLRNLFSSSHPPDEQNRPTVVKGRDGGHMANSGRN